VLSQPPPWQLARARRAANIDSHRLTIDTFYEEYLQVAGTGLIQF
jgi:hypothetical protein